MGEVSIGQQRLAEGHHQAAPQERHIGEKQPDIGHTANTPDPGVPEEQRLHRGVAGIGCDQARPERRVRGYHPDDVDTDVSAINRRDGLLQRIRLSEAVIAQIGGKAREQRTILDPPAGRPQQTECPIRGARCVVVTRMSAPSPSGSGGAGPGQACATTSDVRFASSFLSTGNAAAGTHAAEKAINVFRAASPSLRTSSRGGIGARPSQAIHVRAVALPAATR